MNRSIPYLAKKEQIRGELLRCAREGRTIYYTELGSLVGIPARGPWKPILDEISREETAEKRPDITYVVVNKQTGLPGQIGFATAKPPTSSQRTKADEVIHSVFSHYRVR